MKEISNPFSSMLVTFDPRNFFGRRLHVKQILQGVSSAEPRSFAVHGIKTIGKTSLLKYLCAPEGARAKYKDALVKYGPGRSGELEIRCFDFYAVEGEAVLPTLYEELMSVEQVRRTVATFPFPEVESEAIQPQEARGKLRQLFHALQDQRVRLVICLDHFDRAFQSMEYDDDVFLRNLTGFHSFIIATERSLPELRRDPRRTSPLLNVLIPRNLGLLTEEEARELIRIPAEEASAPFQEAEVTFLLEAAGRQPYLLTIACEFLFDLRIQYPRLDELLPDNERVQRQVVMQMEALPAVTELFSLFWERLDEREQETLLKIATDEPVDSEKEQPVLNSLRQKALIYESLEDGKPHAFSGLFRRYVRRQRQILPRWRIEEVAESLAPLDRRLFEYLVARPNQVCTFKELLTEIWGTADIPAHKRKLEAAIHRVRTRIQEVDGSGWRYIENVRGKGYRYVPRPK